MTMNILRSAASFAAILALAACSSMGAKPPAPANVADGVFVDTQGMTLYTYDKDTAGSNKSVCNGPCAINWPPLMAKDTDQPVGDWTTITRDDGKKQWSYKGRPIYGWIKDTKPGDKTGEGVGGAWHVAKP
ncbi:MAG TPA: hypothetical protein VFW00_09325 [Rhodocyclaceae bacterium]|nr:hypothetical protein [Rhodocyclaceae bacterium]